jgi:2,3-bisphosphoglycerate-dependent phosphoglycerate mutase
MERTAPLWEKKIKYDLKRGRNVLVVAHANTLRGLVKTIDNIGDNEIQEVAIPTGKLLSRFAGPSCPMSPLPFHISIGRRPFRFCFTSGIPIVYKFDKELNPIPPSKEEHSISQVHMNGKFLEKPGLLKEALKREAEWSKNVPGYDSTMNRHKRPMTGLERSLYKLNAERELGAWASEFIDWDKSQAEDDGNDGNFGRPITLTEDEVWDRGMKELEEGDQFDPDAPIFHGVNQAPRVHSISKAPIAYPDVEDDHKQSLVGYHDVEDDRYDDQDDIVVEPNFFARPCVTPISQTSLQNGDAVPTRHDSVIVIIRHGKTQHNKLGLFTGWEDAPLADEGVEEAKAAGRLLKRHGFEFDVVYTSWLSRALETALYVMDEMDALWLPIIKTWRLNERMYGELTGLSKQMVKQRHGEKQFKAWRRGYDVRPPPVSSFSQHYPGNDVRYQKYLRDVRYSVRESIIRSIEGGRLTLARKLPKSESLKDCMDRTIPYFVERIAKDAIDQNKRVLISSSENAIRGLLMHLCDIPESEITGLEIPNGLPIIYDVRSKCVKLLDDGTGRDPLEVYNFGSAAQYLFRPCQNEDGTLDEECSINFGVEDLDSSNIFMSEQDQQTIDFIKQKIGSSSNVFFR